MYVTIANGIIEREHVENPAQQVQLRMVKLLQAYFLYPFVW